MPNKNQPEPRTQLEIKRESGRIWSHLRNKWLIETPEERVRQEYLLVLVNEFGYVLGQMAEELEVTGRGSGKARADFVIWRTVQDKADSKNPLIVVECKSDNVTICSADYGQGDNYSRLVGARFFVTHNSSETRYWRVVHERMPKSLEEIENIPAAAASDREIDEIIGRLRVFKEDEFAKLLETCHKAIRNREKLDPAAAFDEISKILFTKVWVERQMRAKRSRENLFTVEYLDSQLGDSPLDTLFNETKGAYRADEIFRPDDRINLKPATGREIVHNLERYNLSDTSEDVKGIAFERFLGRTFRGEIGQFFTPRPIVEFMTLMLEPTESDVVCDPASGSGGFLIRFFEIVREQILEDVDREYQDRRSEIISLGLSEEEEGEALRKAFDELQAQVQPSRTNSRMWKLANESIFGTDANDRMARTSKMNMIMHGDGHGGVHHSDGFLNLNGIFEERFDLVLTNPPFGANVERTDLVEVVGLTEDEEQAYRKKYGVAYSNARGRTIAAAGQPIASLFELPKSTDTAIKTELLFIERCLGLLKPGGRLGIVLPEGVFNNSSLEFVRDFVERRAFIRAIVSLPEDTFKSAKASVKASILFLEKFSAEDEARFSDAETAATEAASGLAASHAAERQGLVNDVGQAQADAKRSEIKKARVRLKKFDARANEEYCQRLKRELRARFDYAVFMYEAEHVGITSTGAADLNELYPNERQPADLKATCLELYRSFRSDPTDYLLDIQ